MHTRTASVEALNAEYSKLFALLHSADNKLPATNCSKSLYKCNSDLALGPFRWIISSGRFSAAFTDVPLGCPGRCWKGGFSRNGWAATYCGFSIRWLVVHTLFALIQYAPEFQPSLALNAVEGFLSRTSASSTGELPSSPLCPPAPSLVPSLVCLAPPPFAAETRQVS